MLTFSNLKKSRLNHEISGFRLLSSEHAEAPNPEEILEQYRKSIAAIDAYAVAITPIQIVIYGEAPDWYNDDFKQHFTSAKAHSQIWFNSILSDLISVPQSIVNYDELYQSNANDIADYCRLLKRPDVKDRESKEKLLENLIQNLSNSITTKKNLVTNLENQIQTYITTIQADNTFLCNTLASAKSTLTTEQQKLEKFNTQKEELENEIKRISDTITGTGIAGGIALAAAPIGFFCGPVGIVVGIFVTLAAIALLVTTIAENAICNAKRQSLSTIATQISEEGKTVLSLQNFISDLDKIANVAAAARDAANEIKKLWNELEGEINTVVQTLTHGSENAKQKLYDALIDEINSSKEDWNKIVETAKLYEQINIEVKKDVINIPETA